MPSATWDNLAEEKRQRILAAARGEFARCGFQAGSLNVIAGEAGIAKGSLFQYFDDKAELFATVVADNAERVRDATIGAVDLDRPFFEVVHSLIENWIECFVAEPNLLAVSNAASSSRETSLRSSSRATSQNVFRATLVPVIEAAVRRGDLRSDVDTDIVLSMVTMTLRHVRVAALDPNYDPGVDWSNAERDGWPTDRYVEALRRAFGSSE